MSNEKSAQARGPIPGKAGLIMLAAAAVPLIVTAFKPLAKAMGKGLIAAGEALKQAGEEEEAPSKSTAPPKAESTAAKATGPKVTQKAAKVAPTTKVKQERPKKVSAPKPAKKAKSSKVKSVQKSVPTTAKKRKRSVPADIETG